MQKLAPIFILLFSVSGLFSSVSAQTNTDRASVEGRISDTKGNPVAGITIHFEDTNIGSFSDEDGAFEITDIEPGTYVLIVSGIGYQAFRQEITVANSERIELEIRLNDDVIGLDQITVQAQGESAEIERASFTVNSIQTKEIQNTTADVQKVLNESSGIRIRESGGLGSSYELSLNGLSGRQIRIFVDGIPVDQLGSGYNLNNLSVNLVDRVDVYKGVVPIELGADALGGAINIVTDRHTSSFLDASYSAGSFNTHRGALSGRHRWENGFTAGVSGYYNYSDNNYQMNDMTVSVDGVSKEMDITRFHDAYKSRRIAANLGFTNVKWADELMAQFSYAGIDQDIQNGVYGTPVGEATEEEENLSYTVRYRKTNLLNDKLDLDLFGLYNTVTSTSVDTSSNRYNWNGDIIRTENNSLGELVREKTIFEFDQSQYLFRLNAAYALSESIQLSVNELYSDISRKGENRLNTNNDEPFRSPNTLKKSVTGISLDSNFLDDRLEVVAAVKFYHFDMLTKNAVEYTQGEFEIEDIETSSQNLGYALSARFYLLPDLFFKTSFERGFRLPQPREIFGDGLRILANPDLKPESSYNFNVGLSHSYSSSSGIFSNTVNVFQRDVNDYIFHQQEGVFSSYKNVLNVLVRGVEWDGSYNYQDRFSISGNLTWQRVLNNEKYIPGTNTESRVYSDQMPNTPYLFSNLRTSYTFQDLIPESHVSVFYSMNFVHEFYLNYSSISIKSTKNVIPHQFLNHTGITFSTPDSRYNLSLEARNIFNTEAYDSFKLQKPGRSLYIKVRYLFR